MSCRRFHEGGIIVMIFPTLLPTTFLSATSSFRSSFICHLSKPQKGLVKGEFLTASPSIYLILRKKGKRYLNKGATCKMGSLAQLHSFIQDPSDSLHTNEKYPSHNQVTRIFAGKWRKSYPKMLQESSGRYQSFFLKLISEISSSFQFLQSTFLCTSPNH